MPMARTGFAARGGDGPRAGRTRYCLRASGAGLRKRKKRTQHRAMASFEALPMRVRHRALAVPRCFDQTSVVTPVLKFKALSLSHPLWCRRDVEDENKDRGFVGYGVAGYL